MTTETDRDEANALDAEARGLPELAKTHRARASLQAAEAFLDWLRTEGYVLAQYVDRYELPVPVHPSTEHLLAQWQGIDVNAREAERRKVMAEADRQQDRADTTSR